MKVHQRICYVLIHDAVAKGMFIGKSQKEHKLLTLAELPPFPDQAEIALKTKQLKNKLAEAMESSTPITESIFVRLWSQFDNWQEQYFINDFESRMTCLRQIFNVFRKMPIEDPAFIRAFYNLRVLLVPAGRNVIGIGIMPNGREHANQSCFEFANFCLDLLKIHGKKIASTDILANAIYHIVHLCHAQGYNGRGQDHIFTLTLLQQILMSNVPRMSIDRIEKCIHHMNGAFTTSTIFCEPYGIAFINKWIDILWSIKIPDIHKHVNELRQLLKTAGNYDIFKHKFEKARR